ncbi:hypothetical protein NPIL_277931 [Nephila pilipes]|uniref:Uncharacterized protein n=1 Tax=Nephila pilipes TaxID=299642 RepID=A0A8X6PC66_NEPPI|nr:hypothetical protein NPIL_277931 [Nephila pilipes]
MKQLGSQRILGSSESKFSSKNIHDPPNWKGTFISVCVVKLGNGEGFRNLKKLKFFLDIEQLTCEIVTADLMEPRVCSKFWLLLETKETEACQMLQRAFKKDVKRHVQDLEWFGRFKCGDMNLKTLLVLSALHHFQTTKALKKSTKKKSMNIIV